MGSKEKTVSARLKITMTLVAAAALAGVALGCGGDEDSAAGNGDSGSSLSKEEFVEQANAACTKERGEKAIARVVAYRERHESEGLPEDELTRRAYRAAVLGTSEAEIAAIRGLGAPEGDEKEVEGMLAALETALTEARNQEKSSLTNAEDYFSIADKKLRQYGLTGCTKSG